MNFTRKHLAVVFFASVAVAAVGVQANAKPRKNAQVVADMPAPTTIGLNGMPLNNGLDLQETAVKSSRTTSKRSRRAAARAAKAAPVATTAFASSDVVSEARRYIGGNPTGRGSLWCARFMNMVLQHTGHRGTGSDMANSFASYGTRVSGPQVGAIAVMTRGRSGGHVGIITGIDASGNPIMISGNNGNRVREAPISRGRIYAYVMPTG